MNFPHSRTARTLDYTDLRAMWILHVSWAERSRTMFTAMRGILDENPLVLGSIALRQPQSPGVSVLFAEAAACNSFLLQLEGLLEANQQVKTRQFQLSSQDLFDRPLIVLGAPRSGTTLLFETLAHAPDLWTIGGESHEVIEPRALVPNDRGNRLEAADASAEASRIIRAMFVSILRNREQQLYLESEPGQLQAPVRFLEKTPKNSLRVPFLRAIFPDCRFVFLYREPFSNIASLIDGWNTPDRFNSYQLGTVQWKFLLPSGWKSLIGRPVAQIAAAQWRAANTFILNDLESIPRDHWHFVDYQALVENPGAEIRKICAFASLSTDQILDEYLGGPIPLSSSTLTPPFSGKWRRHEAKLAEVIPTVQDVVDRIQRI